MLARQISICLYVAGIVNVGKRGDKRGESDIRMGNDKARALFYNFIGFE